MSGFVPQDVRRAAVSSSAVTAEAATRATAVSDEAAARAAAVSAEAASRAAMDHTTSKTFRTAACTVAQLPGSPVAGDRAFVTDANATTFMTTVAGGGANGVPVVYNGSAWKIG